MTTDSSRLGDLNLFAFDLYDKNSDGTLGVEEIEAMIKDIYGKKAATNTHAKAITYALKALDIKQDIDAETFTQFCKNHYYLLFPAFEMQIYLQGSTLGRGFWNRNADRRVQLSNGRFIPIGKFMELHLNKALYSETVHGAIARSSAPVDDSAMMILATTGTRQQRMESQNHTVTSLDDHGRAIQKLAPAPVPSHRLTQEERYVEHNTKDVAQIYKDITALTKTKLIDANGIARTASHDSDSGGENSNGRISNGRRASTSVVPVNGQSLTLRSRSNSKDSSIDDGNPSAGLALFADVQHDKEQDHEAHLKHKNKPKPAHHNAPGYKSSPRASNGHYHSDSDDEKTGRSTGIAEIINPHQLAKHKDDNHSHHKHHEHHEKSSPHHRDREHSLDRKNVHSSSHNKIEKPPLLPVTPGSPEKLKPMSASHTDGFSLTEMIKKRQEDEEKSIQRKERHQHRAEEREAHKNDHGHHGDHVKGDNHGNHHHHKDKEGKEGGHASHGHTHAAEGEQHISGSRSPSAHAHHRQQHESDHQRHIGHYTDDTEHKQLEERRHSRAATPESTRRNSQDTVKMH
eukprot:gene28841-35778_t